MTLYDYCIAFNRPELLRQWCSEENGEVVPEKVGHGSHKKVWWRCDAGHRWQTPVYSRTTSNSGCPYCPGRKITHSTKTLATEYPELCKQWHPLKNGDLTPNDVVVGTQRKVWWRCEKGHEWQAQVKARTRGNGCPYCSNRKVVVGENDLATTYPEIAAQWHPERNGTRTPQSVLAGNYAKVWWRCEYGHEWQASILARTSNGSGCPVCAGKIVIPGENDLASRFPEIAAQWHPEKNGKLRPEAVTAFSNRKAWWICEKGHTYQAVIGKRSYSNADCPYCTNQKVLAGFNDLATMKPKIADQWHPSLNGALTPQMVTVGSAKKVWWQCKNGHAWKAVIYSRTGGKKCGCPVCAGTTRRSEL